MKNNNKLTLKALKSELELLKSTKLSNNKAKPNTETNSHNAEVAGHDIKGSYINKIYMKSSMFYLWLLTGVLGYATKIPYIGKIITLFGVWYGRTTWWKMLVKLRRMFVIFNAIIGVFVVFNTVGFSTDNIIAGFSAIGHTYYEILFNFTKRLFHWLVELFDHKIVPNVPGDGPSFKKPNTSGYWLPKGIDQSWYNRLPKLENLPSEWYKPGISFNIGQPSIPWYRDWSTLWWVGGILGSLGMAYISYKLYSDPSLVTNFIKNTFFSSNGGGPGASSGPAGTGAPDITQTSPTASSSSGPETRTMGNSIAYFFSKTYHTINPYNWFTSRNNFEMNHDRFLEQQASTDYNNKLWPFTEVNPYYPWYQRAKIYFLGESTIENQVRLEARSIYWEALMPSSNIPGPSGIASSPSAVIQSMPSSPSASALGLNFRPLGFVENIENLNVSNRIQSIPGTPINIGSPSPLDHVSVAWNSQSIINAIAEPETISGPYTPHSDISDSATTITQEVINKASELLENVATAAANSEYDNVAIDNTFVD